MSLISKYVWNIRVVINAAEFDSLPSVRTKETVLDASAPMEAMWRQSLASRARLVAASNAALRHGKIATVSRN